MKSILAACLLALAGPAAAERVLVVADSHSVGPFGTALDARLAEKGREVSLNAVCGASAGWWSSAKRAPLSICWSIHGYGGKNAPQNGAPKTPAPALEALAAAKPDVVVVALGSNPDGSPAETAAAAGSLVAALPPGVRCFWVGPPPMPKRLAAIQAFYKELPKALLAGARTGPSCELIDSRTLIQPQDASANDHFYGPAAVKWGRAVAERVAP